MKTAYGLSLVPLALLISPPTRAAAKPLPHAKPAQISACSLVTPAEAAAVLGKLKGPPKPDKGLLGESECHYENVDGQNLVLRVYGADRWGLKKGETSEMHPSPLKLGSEAFWIKRGAGVEIYIRKGGAILEVDSSAGQVKAAKVAEKALSRLPGK